MTFLNMMTHKSGTNVIQSQSIVPWSAACGGFCVVAIFGQLIAADTTISSFTIFSVVKSSIVIA
jgi:hypothetical protein